MEDVPLKFILTFSYQFFLVDYLLVSIFHFFVDVTCVVASSRGAVFFPFGEAKPTEFVFTFWTCHMITSLIFLNEVFATWTRFCICLDPCKIFWVILFFFLPNFEKMTWCWNMVFLTTLETKYHSTIAFDLIFGSIVWFLNDKTTIFCRTPFNISIIISKLLAMPLIIFFKIVYTVIINKSF